MSIKVAGGSDIREEVLEHVGSLITGNRDGVRRCLGYLFVAGLDVYEPSRGKVDVTPSDAETHNKLLSAALIDGLNNCPVGFGGTFYLHEDGDKPKVVTWTGEVVSEDVILSRATRVVKGFRRNGMTFLGRRAKDGDLFRFQRTK